MADSYDLASFPDPVAAMEALNDEICRRDGQVAEDKQDVEKRKDELLKAQAVYDAAFDDAYIRIESEAKGSGDKATATSIKASARLACAKADKDISAARARIYGAERKLDLAVAQRKRFERSFDIMRKVTDEWIQNTSRDTAIFTRMKHSTR